VSTLSLDEVRKVLETRLGAPPTNLGLEPRDESSEPIMVLPSEYVLGLIGEFEKPKFITQKIPSRDHETFDWDAFFAEGHWVEYGAAVKPEKAPETVCPLVAVFQSFDVRQIMKVRSTTRQRLLFPDPWGVDDYWISVRAHLSSTAFRFFRDATDSGQLAKLPSADDLTDFLYWIAQQQGRRYITQAQEPNGTKVKKKPIDLDAVYRAAKSAANYALARYEPDYFERAVIRGRVGGQHSKRGKANHTPTVAEVAILDRMHRRVDGKPLTAKSMAMFYGDISLQRTIERRRTEAKAAI
jgi:hypothetical protein